MQVFTRFYVANVNEAKLDRIYTPDILSLFQILLVRHALDAMTLNAMTLGKTTFIIMIFSITAQSIRI